MATAHFQIRKLDELETLLPGFRKVWPALKAACGSRTRCPRGVTFTDEARRAYLNDDECGARFSLDLRTMELDARRLPISGGEWAVHAGPHHDGAVAGLPGSHAMLTCTWNDYHRYFSLEVQVAELPKALPTQAAS